MLKSSDPLSMNGSRMQSVEEGIIMSFSYFFYLFILFPPSRFIIIYFSPSHCSSGNIFYMMMSHLNFSTKKDENISGWARLYWLSGSLTGRGPAGLEPFKVIRDKNTPPLTRMTTSIRAKL